MSSEYKWVDDVLDAIKREEAVEQARREKRNQYGNWLGLALSRMEFLVNYYDGKIPWNSESLQRVDETVEACRHMLKMMKDEGVL